jgi:hypothetical protein
MDKLFVQRDILNQPLLIYFLPFTFSHAPVKNLADERTVAAEHLKSLYCKW